MRFLLPVGVFFFFFCFFFVAIILLSKSVAVDTVLRADLQCLLECLVLVREALPPVIPVANAPALLINRSFHNLSTENASSLLHGSGVLSPDIPADFATTVFFIFLFFKKINLAVTNVIR